jgi:amidohydrolase
MAALDLVSLRRDLHRHPELSFTEDRTSALVADQLRLAGLTVRDRIGGSPALVATLEGRRPGKVLVLRADIDALRIPEESGVPYASEVPGLMHACGHDAHTALLVEAARVLSRRTQEFDGTIVFVFEPGEEDGRGARFLIDHGVLDSPKVDAALGLHADPRIPAGTVSVREGATFAAWGSFTLEVVGKGGHPGQPHQTVDAIVVAAQIVQAAQLITSRQSDPQKPFTIGFGTIHGGQQANAIPGTVTLQGTIRSLEEAGLGWGLERLEVVARHVAQGFGADIRFQVHQTGLPLVNDDQLTALFRGALAEGLGPAAVLREAPLLAGEDFALFAKAVPSTFVMWGVGHPDRPNYPLHHPKFDINEEALPTGVNVFVLGALKYLAQGTNHG